jgi:hypothetical protein
LATAVNRSDFGRRRFGDLLVRARLVTERQFQDALDEQALSGGRLNDVLIRRGVMTAESLVHALMTHLGLARAQTTMSVDQDLLALVPREFAETHEVVPLAFVGGRTLVVAASDPLDFTMIDWLRARSGCYIEPRVATGTDIRDAIDRLYGITVDESKSVVMELVTTAQDHALSSVPPTMPTTRLRSVPAAEYSPVEATRPEGERRNDLARETKALRALVQLLIDKGVISREEYLERLR